MWLRLSHERRRDAIFAMEADTPEEQKISPAGLFAGRFARAVQEESGKSVREGAWGNKNAWQPGRSPEAE